MTDTNDEVPAFLDQIDITVVETEFDIELRIQFRETWQQRRDFSNAERHRHVGPQLPLYLRCGLQETRFRLGNIVEDRLNRFEEGPACLRQCHLPGRSMKQPGAKAVLESSNVLGGHRL